MPQPTSGEPGASTPSAAAQAAVRVERDIVYGQASIGYGTPQAGTRHLCLDAYLPSSEAPPGCHPALVLSHGGAYHRGAKDREEFEQGGSRNTPVHEYCERFAARGYACFSVGYWLTQELPPPQPKPIKRNRQTVHRGRIDFVRELLGLPPATHEELLNGAEAAFADVTAAFAFLHTHAARWGIDPGRMAIGGFSAGGFASAYAPARAAGAGNASKPISSDTPTSSGPFDAAQPRDDATYARRQAR